MDSPGTDKGPYPQEVYSRLAIERELREDAERAHEALLRAHAAVQRAAAEEAGD